MEDKELMRQKELLGRRVRALRTANGLTQQQLGEQADVHYKFIGEVERGERFPSTAILFKLADALGIPAREMLVFEHELTGTKALEKAIRTRLKGADEDQLQMFLKLLDSILY
jgi:transcriptional regulator with XRE-family HTH domain